MLPALVILGLSRRVVGHLEELVLLAQMAVLTLAVVVEPEQLVLLLLGLTVELAELGREEEGAALQALPAPVGDLVLVVMVVTEKSRFGCTADG
jgi:hypothetical protein